MGAAPIFVRGVVAKDAQHRRRPDGSSVVTFDVRVPGSGARPLLLRVQTAYPVGEAAAQVAGMRARRLRRGVAVEAGGSGITRLRGVLVLEGVDHVHEPDLQLRNVTGERDA